jgi:hypothetical protein
MGGALNHLNAFGLNDEDEEEKSEDEPNGI